MSDQMDVHGVMQEDDKVQTEVVGYILEQDPSGDCRDGSVDDVGSGDLRAGSSADVQVPSTSLQINRVKKRVGPAVSQKELSKQWKFLCKRAKEWCGLHGSNVPSFVMMYLDQNKLVWEGPDHMESFISDENVISAFLRTAVATGNIDKPSDQQHLQQQQHHHYQEIVYLDQNHQGVSEAENTVVQALEQLGQLQPLQGGSNHQTITHYVTTSSAAQGIADDATTGYAPDQGGEEDLEAEDDADAMNIDADEQSHTTSEHIVAAEVAEGSADVLSDVIDSVIKDWDGPVPGSADKVRRSRSGRRIRPPGIVVDTTVGTFEIVRNAVKKGQKAKLQPSDDVKVIRMNRNPTSSMSAGTAPYRQLCPCPECGKTISRSNLTAHMRIHKGEFRFFCDVCQKGFYTRKDLNVHYRIHTGERPYNCPVCFKAFRQKSKVKEHMLTHTGYKPHVCTHCRHTFARRSDLKCHIRLHTGEKPYQCPECSKRFTQPGNFRAHLRTHSRDQRGHIFGPCDACGRTYSSMSSWKEHIRTHHAEQQENDAMQIQPVDKDVESIILHESANGGQILVDISSASGGGAQTITLNMTEGDMMHAGGDDIQTIFIDQGQHAAMQSGGGSVVMITGEQAARLMSLTQQ